MGMKAYALDLRERVVKFIQAGGSKVEAGRRFSLARSTIYRYLTAVKTNTLAPKPVGAPGASWSRPNGKPTLKSSPTPRWWNCKKFLPSVITRCGRA